MAVTNIAFEVVKEKNRVSLLIFSMLLELKIVYNFEFIISIVPREKQLNLPYHTKLEWLLNADNAL